MKITFNSPYLTGKELDYIREAVESGHLSGNGNFTKRCQAFFEERYGIKKALMTTSCSDALEMCALLLRIQPGDEVIVPSFTFVSSALAFVREGAKIVFADSKEDHPNIDVEHVRQLISPKTKAIVVVHYAGIACEMDSLRGIAEEHDIAIVEDAAQAVEAAYRGQALGTIGDLAAFSFHETKNVQCGEGGMLCINNSKYVDRAEILWEKGTNRSSFFRGEIDKYGWVDTGSSFLPSELNAAFLYAQLEKIEDIQERRMKRWRYYFDQLKPLADQGKFILHATPEFATENAHMFYLICSSEEDRSELLARFKEAEIRATFHYQPLHNSSFFKTKLEKSGDEIPYLPNAERFSSRLIRLPLYNTLTPEDQELVLEVIRTFFNG